MPLGRADSEHLLVSLLRGCDCRKRRAMTVLILFVTQTKHLVNIIDFGGNVRDFRRGNRAELIIIKTTSPVLWLAEAHPLAPT
jgi:hypothetical protein